MAKRKNRKDEGSLGDKYIFEEMNKVKVLPGLGIFYDPLEEIKPGKDGKIPIRVRGSDTFEMMRYRVMESKVLQFIQENRDDLIEMKVDPRSFRLATAISSAYLTERQLREFVGSDDEVWESDYTWSERMWDTHEWVVGQGWVKKKVETPSYSYEGHEYGWSREGWGDYKPKKYRTLSTILKPIIEDVRKEMRENALGILEDPSDLPKVIMVKILEDFDVIGHESGDIGVGYVVNSIMSSIRWEVGYSSPLDQIEHLVEDLALYTKNRLSAIFSESTSPEKLFVNLATLMDVDVQEYVQAIGRSFGVLLKSIEEEEDDTKGYSSEGDYNLDSPDGLVFVENTVPHIISYDSGKTAPWGILKIVEHPLTSNNDLQRRALVSRATDIGTHIGDLSRLLTDQRIFKEMRPQHRGSLLVDCSSSMGMRTDDVLKVLEHIPGVTIGLYSGYGPSGKLEIVARGGRVVRNLTKVINQVLSRSGNVVDGPALEWLMVQPHPRIWYSDGGATGAGDMPSLDLRNAVDQLMAAGRIGRIKNQKLVPQAFRFMRKEKNIGPARLR